MVKLSIRSRLIVGLALGLSVLVSAMLYVVYRKALVEAAELVDGDLIAAARVAVQLSSNTPFTVAPAPALLARDPYETPLVVQFWSREGTLLAHLGAAVRASASPRHSGFADLEIDARKWRTYSVINNVGTVWVRTMVTADGRNLIARDIATHLALSGIVVVPLMLIFLWVYVAYLLRPLGNFSGAIGRTRMNQLTHIDLRPEARELEPVAGAINLLVGRMKSERDIERAFIADAAHELRTPLSGIQLHAQTALAETDPVRLRRSLTSIETGSQRAAHLVNQLLGLAQYDGVKKLPMMPIRVDGLVRNVLATILPIADARGVELASELGANVAVLGNAASLELMLQNLLANAIQFSPQGAVVTVRVVDMGRHVAVSVSDQGPGIPKDARRHIFERFARLPGSPAGGSGLGLAIVHRILLLHRARIAVAASENGGAMFTVSLRSTDTKPSTTTEL
ncbi:MAG: ATP-binding protein [Casimicrobium sp.]|jgi:two-component system sensor histidine kinase QseC